MKNKYIFTNIMLLLFLRFVKRIVYKTNYKWAKTRIKRRKNTMKENKEILTMNAQELQAEVAVATGLSKTKMAEVMKAVNESVTTALKQAKDGTDVLVKLFPGVTITAEFVDKHEVRRPVDGAMVMKDAEIKVRAKATSPIKNAVNA